MLQGVQVSSSIIQEPPRFETLTHIQANTGVCPKSGSQTVQRLTKKGHNAGNSFLAFTASLFYPHSFVFYLLE